MKKARLKFLRMFSEFRAAELDARIQTSAADYYQKANTELWQVIAQQKAKLSRKPRVASARASVTDQAV